MTDEDIYQREAREIDRGVLGYSAPEKPRRRERRDSFRVSSRDKDMIAGLSSHLSRRGVIQRSDGEALEEDGDFTEIMRSAGDAAMQDSEVNPGAFSDDEEIRSVIAAKEFRDASDQNPNIDYSDEEYERWVAQQIESGQRLGTEESGRVLGVFHQKRDDAPEGRGGRRGRNGYGDYYHLSTRKREHDDALYTVVESDDDDDVQAGASEQEIDPADLILARRLLRKPQLSDGDIADVVDSLTVEDIKLLRRGM